MYFNVTQVKTASGISAMKTPAIVARLLQAAALTLLLIPVSAVAVEAGPITCEFGGNEVGDGLGCSEIDDSRHIFDFGLYSFDLNFLSALTKGPFLITVTDLVGPIPPARLGPFSDHVCVPITGFQCVEFEVDDASGGGGWDGFFDAEIRWLPNTDIAFPDDGGRIRVLHARGDSGDDVYDTDITVEGSYIPPPSEVDIAKVLGDPAITGHDDNFQLFTVTQAPAVVPEPATLLLITTGLGGLLYRRRRRAT